MDVLSVDAAADGDPIGLFGRKHLRSARSVWRCVICIFYVDSRLLSDFVLYLRA